MAEKTMTRDDAYGRAQELEIEGRSGMDKAELLSAIEEAERGSAPEPEPEAIAEPEKGEDLTEPESARLNDAADAVEEMAGTRPTDGQDQDYSGTPIIWTTGSGTEIESEVAHDHGDGLVSFHTGGSKLQTAHKGDAPGEWRER